MVALSSLCSSDLKDIARLCLGKQRKFENIVMKCHESLISRKFDMECFTYKWLLLIYSFHFLVKFCMSLEPSNPIDDLRKGPSKTFEATVGDM